MTTQITRNFTNGAIVAVFLASCCVVSFYPHTFAQYQSGAVRKPAGNKEAKPAAKEWKSFKSAYFTIEYSRDVNLKKVERKLRRHGIFFVSELNPKINNLSTTEDKIAYRLDMLFRKAKDILDMRPRIAGIKIKIFKSRKELAEEYYRIFGKRSREDAFFIYRYNTIYACEDKISDSVMAHEMGHAIVDHYFVVRPPESVRELLSQYVDLHLED